jgi:protein-L-isoaspartate O-methyltransferase
MSKADFDPKEFKNGQRQQWDAAAAGWKKWWEYIERSAGSVSARMLDLAEVGSGQRVLDVATGIGEPAVSAARRVGADGSVLGTDQAPRC